MSSDDTTQGDDSGPKAKLEELDERVAESGVVSERLATVRTRIEEYKATEDESEQTELREQVESELQAVRDAIESELDKGKAKAHNLVDEIEKRFSRLRRE